MAENRLRMYPSVPFGSQHEAQVFFRLRSPCLIVGADRLSPSTGDSLTARACASRACCRLTPPSPCFRAAGIGLSRLESDAPKAGGSAFRLFVQCDESRPKKNLEGVAAHFEVSPFREKFGHARQCERGTDARQPRFTQDFFCRFLRSPARDPRQRGIPRLAGRPAGS